MSNNNGNRVVRMWQACGDVVDGKGNGKCCKHFLERILPG